MGFSGRLAVDLDVSFLRIFFRNLLVCGVVATVLGGASRAQTITGVVTNKTNSKASAGDDVVLLKLAQGMQELARAKTDGRGRFTIKVPAGEAESLHMIRVTHDKANYFRPVQPGAQSVEVEVFNAASAVEGVTLTEDVMQVQTEPGGQSLRIVEHFLVKNASTPPMTLFSEHPFELNLPAGATVEGAAAKAPGGMAVQSPLVPLGDASHYTMIFPIRPGDTEFHLWYHVPYTGSFTFKPKPTMATTNLAIMMPKSMTFKAGAGTGYTTVTEDVGGAAQAFVARNVVPSEPLEFTVSGTGELPRESAATQGGQGATGAPGPAGATDVDPSKDTRPGGGLGVPVDKDAERDPWTKYRWWIVGGLGLALAAAAGFVMKAPGPKPIGTATVAGAGSGSGLPQGAGGSALEVLRDEMFAVETDRLEGRLSEHEYGQLKTAFDVVLRRALTRSGTTQIVTE